MDAQNQPVGIPTSPYKKSKKKLIISAVIVTFLIATIVFGATTNFFGMMMQNTSSTDDTKIKLNNTGAGTIDTGTTSDVYHDGDTLTVVATPSLMTSNVELSKDGKTFIGTYCATATQGTEPIKALFKVNDIEKITIGTAPAATSSPSCVTISSEDITAFEFNAGETVSVKFTVLFKNITESTITDNTTTKSITVPTGQAEQTDTSSTLDLYFKDEDGNIGIDNELFYAYVCSTEDKKGVQVRFNIKDSPIVSTIDLKKGQCTKTTAEILDFTLSTDVEYTLDVTIDPTNAIKETIEETNNKDIYKFTIPNKEEEVSSTTDLYIGDETGIGYKDNMFYGEFCAKGTTGMEQIKINFNANGKDDALTITAPSDGKCQTYSSHGVNETFNPDETKSYTLTVTIDYNNTITEINENNNTKNTEIEAITDEGEEMNTPEGYTPDTEEDSDNSTTPDLTTDETKPNLYISDIGVDNVNPSMFYAKICAENMDTAESIKINFNANNKDNTLGFTSPTSDTCKTIYSWEFNTFDIDSTISATYTLKTTVDYHKYVDESNEDDNTLTKEITFEESSVGSTNGTNTTTTTQEDEWLKKYTVIMMRIGDLEGTTDADATTDYISSLTSDTLLIKPIESVLFEKGDDEYKASTSGFEIDNTIYDHWDGVIFLAYYDSTTAKGQTPSFKVNVDGTQVNKTISSLKDLTQIYALGDSTDNAVDFIIIDDYKVLPETIKDEGDIAGNESADEIAEKTQEVLTDRYEGMTDALESLDVSEGSTDTETGTAVTSLVTTLASVATKDSMTAEEAGVTYKETEASIEAETANGGVVTPDSVSAVEEDTDSAALKDYSAGFNDVSTGSWYEPYVDKAEYYGVVSGYENGNFGPNDPVTRAALVKMVLNAFEYDIRTDIAYNEYFSDLTADAWYTPYVNTARYEELIAGYSNGTFGPNNTVNRAEALKAIIEASGVEEKGRPEIGTEDTWTNVFSDVDTYDWYYTYVMEGYNASIISGNTGTFRPADTLTRAEACKIIVELMDLLATPTM